MMGRGEASLDESFGFFDESEGDDVAIEGFDAANPRKEPTGSVRVDKRKAGPVPGKANERKTGMVLEELIESLDDCASDGPDLEDNLEIVSVVSDGGNGDELERNVEVRTDYIPIALEIEKVEAEAGKFAFNCIELRLGDELEECLAWFQGTMDDDGVVEYARHLKFPQIVTGRRCSRIALRWRRVCHRRHSYDTAA